MRHMRKVRRALSLGKSYALAPIQQVLFPPIEWSVFGLQKITGCPLYLERPQRLNDDPHLLQGPSIPPASFRFDCTVRGLCLNGPKKRPKDKDTDGPPRAFRKACRPAPCCTDGLAPGGKAVGHNSAEIPHQRIHRIGRLSLRIRYVRC